MLNEILKLKRAASHFVMLSFFVGAITAILDFTVNQAFADVLADFEQAEVYDDNGQHTQAAQVYQNIIAQYPGTTDALTAQTRLTRMYVFSGQMQEAQIAYQDLITSFSGHSGITKAVCEVADSYLYLNRQPQKALELYKYVLATWPNSNDAMWAQAGIVKVHVQLQDKSSSQAAYETLLVSFSAHKNIPEAVYEIADSYQQSNLRKALELYEYAMSTWPDYNKWIDENDALLRRKNIVLLKLGLGDETGAQAAYDSMIGFSTDDITTAETVTELANAYLDSGNYQRARQLFEYAKGRWSAAGISEIWAEVGLAKTDIAIGNDPNLQSVAKLVAEYSKDQDLQQAVFAVVGRCYIESAAKENEGDNPGATKYL